LKEVKKYQSIANRVQSYYASMPVKLKMHILEEFRSGRLQVIIATNALEAGIDIPELDVCMIKGYPGSHISFLQRTGRVGRRGAGLVIFLPSIFSPLDFYFAEHPQALLNGTIESVAFNADYSALKTKHLWCACVETGIFCDSVSRLFGPDSHELLETLKQQGFCWKQQRRLFYSNQNNNNDDDNKRSCVEVWTGKGFPHNELSIRNGRFEYNIDAILKSNQKMLEKVNERQAIYRLFPGAIFVCHSEALDKLARYDVESVLWRERKAFLVPSKYSANVAVVPLKETKVKIMRIMQEKTFSVGNEENMNAELRLTFGWGHIVTSVYGCETFLRSFNKEEEHGAFDLGNKINLVQFKEPLETLHEAPFLRLSFSDSTRRLFNSRMSTAISSLSSQLNREPELTERFTKLLKDDPAFIAIHTMLHQLIAVVPLLLLSSNDIDEAELDMLKCEGFLVDSIHGGTGVCERIFDDFLEFVSKAVDYSSCCSYCRGEWGCAVCLYRLHCDLSNASLLNSVGLQAMNLKELDIRDRHQLNCSPQETIE